MKKTLGLTLMTVVLAALAAVIARQQATIEELRDQTKFLSDNVEYLRRTVRSADSQRLSSLVESACLVREVDDLRAELGAKSGTRSRTLAVTAYTASPDETDDAPVLTASNRPVRLGTVAVSQDLYKNGWSFGKKVYIDSLGVYEINDLVGSQHKRRIDVFMNDKGKALRFGIQSRKITLLE